MARDVNGEPSFTTEAVTHTIEEVKALTELYVNGNKTNTANIDGEPKNSWRRPQRPDLGGTPRLSSPPVAPDRQIESD